MVWGTGFVGKMVIAEVVKHPLFELVGVGVSNPDKVGRDVGEIGIVKLFTLFGGCEDWLLWRLR